MKYISDTENTAMDWINYNTKTAKNNEQQFNNIDVKLTELATDKPFECWVVLLEIFKLTCHIELLKKIARGPLERLLLLHPGQINQLIKTEKKNNPVLQKTLTLVCPDYLRNNLL